MPRQARLDAPDTLHPIMVRGIDRTPIFRDDPDRTEFLGRLAARAEPGALTIYAWALLPTHGHLLVRTGRQPLVRSMRCLLTGYAGAFTRATSGAATCSRTATRPSWWRKRRPAWSWSGISI